MATVTLRASRLSSIGKTAHRPDRTVAGERVIGGDEAREGDARDWVRDLLNDPGFPVIGLVWEVARLAVADQRFEMYQGDSVSILVEATDIPLDGADITYQIDTPGANILKRVGAGIVVRPEDGTFEVVLDPADTENVAGIFRQQARVVDAVGQESVVLDGYVNVKPRIREE